MALSIQSTPMQIGWEKQNATQDIRQNHRIYEVQSTQAKLELDITHPKITIDQTEQFAEAGLKNIKAFMDSNASYARQALSQGVDNIISEGNQLAAIENPENPIPDMAEYNAFTKWNQKEFNIGFVPSPTNRPNIQLIRGNIKANFRKGNVDIRRNGEKSVEINATTPKINYHVKQYNSISIEYKGEQIDRTV